jgi:hypothetical protein
MNNNNKEKLITALSSVHMTDDEKRAMRMRILDTTPMIVSPYHRLTRIMYQSLSVAFMALLTVGSLLKPASVQALPGEFLYPLKMIHEEIESVTKQNSEDKISHEIQRTNERIEEVTRLAEDKTLDSKKREQLSKNIKKHTAKAKEEIQELKTHDPIKALELNHQLQDSIKSNVERLKTQEGAAKPEIDSHVVAPIVHNEEVDDSLQNDDVQEEVMVSVINEIDVALPVIEGSGFNDILLEMEADLKAAEQESEEAQRDITETVISPSEITQTDGLIDNE